MAVAAPRPRPAPGGPPDAPQEGQLAVRQVARLFGLSEQRLRYWAQTGFLVPSRREKGRARYTFRDLIAVKVAKELLDAGLPLQRVRRSLDALRLKLARSQGDLASLRIRCDQDRVIVEDEAGAFEAVTGQRVLDFQVGDLSDDVAQVLAMPWTTRAREAGGPSAYESFLEGCALEDDDPARAAACYRRAVDLDPDLAAAWTNLGSLQVEAGDVDGARDSFAEALRSDPDQPEARLNLAELALREQDAELAIEGYRGVLVQHPDHPEAHYGLARALLAVGGRAQALAHLERFCRAMDGVADPRMASVRRTMARLSGDEPGGRKGP